MLRRHHGQLTACGDSVHTAPPTGTPGSDRAWALQMGSACPSAEDCSSWQARPSVFLLVLHAKATRALQGGTNGRRLRAFLCQVGAETGSVSGHVPQHGWTGQWQAAPALVIWRPFSAVSERFPPQRPRLDERNNPPGMSHCSSVRRYAAADTKSLPSYDDGTGDERTESQSTSAVHN